LASIEGRVHMDSVSRHRPFPDWDVYYTLFARSFGQELQVRANAEGDIFLYTPEDVLADLASY